MSADPVTAPPYPAACPACGATVRSAVAWCTLCYASLLPAAAEPAAPEPDADVAQLAPDAGQAGEPDGGAGRTAPDVVVQQLLAELAASREPAPAWASRLPGGRAGKAIVMIGGGAAASLLLLGLMALIGLFL